MTERRFYFGLVATIIWIATMALLFRWSGTEASHLRPNEWGDFFAGIFAPLAFLWLVLGYLQQGEELRLSTEALRLQAEELKNSVEQQRELVEVTRQQVEGEREALAFERLQREEEARPSFVVVGGGGSFHANGHCTYNIHLSNTGNAATALLVDVVPPARAPHRLLDVPLFGRGKQWPLKYETVEPLEGAETQLLLSFNDILGKQYHIAYSIQRETEDPHSSLSFTKTGA
ncbi:MAG: hypothetical protein WBP72_03150 [Rhodocyclaceae bacterium]